jgi:hypothetical protein
VEAAAAAAGISAASAYRWMQDPVVVQRLAEARPDQSWCRGIGCDLIFHLPWAWLLLYQNSSI